jgi:flagellar M-ring protein FliF
VTRLGELAKRAVGFDAARGDELDISSSPFIRSEDASGQAAAPAAAARFPTKVHLALGGGALLFVVVAAVLLGRRRSGAAGPLLVPGSSVSEIEARMAAGQALSGAAAAPALSDPAAMLRERAKILAAKDPARAANILKAWMNEGQGA